MCEEVKTKVCSLCRVEKSINDFGNHKGGKYCQCKVCASLSKQQAQVLRDKRNELDKIEFDKYMEKAIKKCCKCKVEKPFSDFYATSTNKDGLHTVCISCSKEYYASDPERNKLRWQQYSNKNQDKLRRYTESRTEAKREYDERYRLENAEKIQERNIRNREKRNAKRREYGIKNRAKILADNAKRVAAKLKAIPKWADMDAIKQIYKECSDMSKATGIEYHVDHMVPLRGKTVCGLHCEDNLRIILGSENCKKLNTHWPDMPDYTKQDKQELMKLRKELTNEQT